MAQSPPTAPVGVELLDELSTFEAGMNSGIAPALLTKKQLAFLSNGTVRGTYATQRPPYRQLAVDYGGNAALQAAVEGGLFQGACYGYPDNGTESLIASISGGLYEFIVNGAAATCFDRTIPGNPNPATNPQAWLWQAENWIIVNDGASTPIFFDLNTKIARRSLVQNRTQSSGTLNADFVIPVIDGTTPVNLVFAAVTGLTVNQVINVWGVGQFKVTNVGADPTIVCVNINALPVGGTVVAPGTVTWSTAISELPPGRQGAYWRGRIWMALTDGIQFIAGDIVGGPSGTLAENFRDAILKISENTYLAGGGNFRVPGSVGKIQAIVPTATLDASLGQGSLAILTPTIVFSVNASADRLTWSSMQNPILTESLLANGGQGQNSTVPANGDTIFRSIDGVRSLILGRRDFDTWGNVPISREMNRILPLDVIKLLPFGSAIVLENRLLMTASPIALADRGVYHAGLVVINFDPISSMGGKAPSVWDGLWTGLNTLQLVKGYFDSIERGFAFHMNTQAGNKIQIWEVMPTPPDISNPTAVPTIDQIYDNSVNPVVMLFEAPELNFGEKDRRQRTYKALVDGEIEVDQIWGRVDFQAFYKPDQYPCWIPWHNWSECATMSPNGQLQFRPRMGLGCPNGTLCDTTTNRPLREGYTFQFKLIVQGHCVFKGARFRATVRSEPKFAPPNCTPIC